MSLRRDYSLSTGSPSTPIRNTSTPFPTRRKSILSPKPNSIFSRRYSLSDVDCITPIQKNSRFLSPKNGPNSIKSPSNMRQSPENKELLINHQKMRYNKPGVFPIVHLNKQNLPILKEKPKNVTVRLASPELFRQNSAEHNRLLLEKVVRNSPKRTLSATTTPTTNGPTMTTNRNIEISTRSVLDALKEISRKRIHTNEELENLKDDGKRIRLDRINDDLLLNKKRQRGESPPYETCQNSNKKLIKRQCSLSEVLASQSSMEIKSSPESSLSVSSNESKQKNKVVAEVEIHAPSKKPCLVNAETQTQIVEQKSNLKEVGVQSKESMPPVMNKENVEKSTVETSSSTPTSTTTTVKSPACLKVFDEAPLERTRKDRLSVLMGIKRKSIDLKTNLEDKPIMSILSNSINKHLKSNTPKHVTFNLESESTNNTMQEQQEQPIEKTVNPVVSNNVSITQTTASITTPLISSVVSETTKSPNKGVVQTNEAKMISKETVGFNQAKTTENAVVSTFNFIATKPESSTSNPVTSISTIPTNNLFISPNKTGNAPTTTTTSTPQKIGGFKFDLKPTATSNSSFPLPTTTATATQATTKENPKPAFFFAGGSNSAGLNQATATTTSSNSTNIAPQFSLSSAVPKFNFTSTVTTTTTTPTTISTSLGFTQSSSRSFGNTGGFGLNFTPQTTQSFVNPNPVATTPSFVNPNPVATTPSFVNPNPVATTPSFVNPNPVATTTAHTFKIQSPQYNLFGNINPAVTTTTTTISGTSSGFGIPSTTSNVFGTNPAPPTFGSAGFNFGGGGSATNAQIEKPTFGNIPATQNLFTTTTTAPATTTTSIFNANVFNTTNTTNPATSQINPPAFGAMNNSTNIFGSSNAFNTPPSQQQQQQQSTTTVTRPQQNPPTFGNVFDTNKPPAFGDNSTAFSTTTFGSTTFGTTNQNQPIFGGNSSNTNNTSGSFSTNPPPAASSPPQGGVFSFGGNPNKAGGVFSFGQTEPPKPTFNFASNTGNTGGFNNSFTAAATNNNSTAGGTPQFNPPVAGAMFNIGAGGAASTPRARTQLKAKRRT